jgi:hypothetical protein
LDKKRSERSAFHHVRQQGYLAGELDRLGKLPLVQSAGTRNATGQNLSAVGQVPSQLLGVLEVDQDNSIGTEVADFLFSGIWRHRRDVPSSY